MADIDIDPKVFNDAYFPYLKCNSRVQIFYGGASSGKSVFLAQRDIVDLLRGGRNFLICRQIGRTLRGSVVQEMAKVISDWNISHLFSINKTDGTITASNGYQAIFVGLDDVEKIKSITPAKGVFTDIRVEEATETDERSLKQLMKRQRGGDPKTPKRITLSFNPILQLHWIYKTYFSKLKWADDQTQYQDDRLSILKTTYKDNKFLTKDDVRDLENETDKYFFEVYTRGNWGVLGNVIFTNWRVEDLSGMSDQFTNHRAGLDFGFASDPTALGVSHYDRTRKTIYFYKELYETGLTNDVLAPIVIDMVGEKRVIGDSADPRSIAELQNLGVNVVGAKKGPDSVLHGIQWLQQQTIIVDTSCINMRNELQLAKWKEDAGGEIVHRNGDPVPIDKNNHLIDGGLRYAYEDDMSETWLIS
jgi:phage terminase large subunit